MKTYATIESQYYLLNSKHNKFKNTSEAWNALLKYINDKYSNSENEEIIIDEQKKTVQIITKNTKSLKMDRYVPIKSPVNIDDLDANVK